MQKFFKQGSKTHVLQLNHWREGKVATWNFSVNDTKVNQQLLHRKRKAENLEVETKNVNMKLKSYKQKTKQKVCEKTFI